LIIKCRCGTPLELDDDMLGEEIQCPRCRMIMVVPAPPSPAQTAPVQPNQWNESPPAPRPPIQPSYPPQASPASAQAVPGTITSAKAMACLNLGINSFTVPFVLVIPSILFGLAALRECRRYGMQGKSMALTGMSLSVFSSLCLGILIYMAYPMIKQTLELRKGLDMDKIKELQKGLDPEKGLDPDKLM
jgi:hypothetical protein